MLVPVCVCLCRREGGEWDLEERWPLNLHLDLDEKPDFNLILGEMAPLIICHI